MISTGQKSSIFNTPSKWTFLSWWSFHLRWNHQATKITHQIVQKSIPWIESVHGYHSSSLLQSSLILVVCNKDKDWYPYVRLRHNIYYLLQYSSAILFCNTLLFIWFDFIKLIITKYFYSTYTSYINMIWYDISYNYL